MPHVALTIELVFAVAAVAWFDYARHRDGVPLTRGRRIALYALFTIGIASWYPVATTPLRQMLH